MAELLSALPRSKRPMARWLCRAVARSVQTLEVGKASFLMALDAGRAATRAIGRELCDAGSLDEVDDAFYLTIDELLAPLPDDVMDLVRFRRKRREEYRGCELPPTFTGMPVPTRAGDHGISTDTAITGVAGAPGSAEGRARVIVDPDDGDGLDPGEILVCRFTDPSWAPLFTLADALVIDIGAAASHGAIVARELGVPCVIGTGDGTRRIRTGDLLRVDGSAGVVEILEGGPDSDGGG
jgi:pyruvate,water dikinase